MVIISNAIMRQNNKGESFTSLILTGGVEMVTSKTTGKLYARTKKASIPSTLDPETAKMMVGQKLDGNIVKVACEEYDFTGEDGETITLDYRYEYEEEENSTETLPDEAYEH